LFTVVLEQFMTDTADHADYVLPATTQLEHLDVHTSYGHRYALINEPAIAPLGEARPNTGVFRELAQRMGFQAPCFRDSDEDMARVAFTKDVGFDALRAHGWVKLPLAEAPLADGGFRTPSGKCLIDSPQFGVPDYVPNYESAASTPQLAERYPLAMISPPARNFLNSSFVNLESLRDIEGEPIVEMHESDALARGIANGRMVRVFNDRGEYVCKAMLSQRARPGVVNGLGIWWRKLGVAGTNVNEVTHQRLTDIGRAPSFYDCLVDVRPVAVADS
jgi:anaerobic selenocysteine-containing dehydrogenase